MPQKRDIVVIGGSAGSGAVLKQFAAGLPSDLPASVFITTHVPMSGPAYLAELMDATAKIPVVQAADGQPIEPGRVYVAPPDRHLLLIDGVMRLGLGPRENMCRPAIDPMFRSAALSYRERVVGVVLTGMLNDGASGLHAVKQCGGVTVVQHPLDAAAPDMPRAALEASNVDHVVKAAELSALIVNLVAESPEAAGRCPPGLELEVSIAAGRRVGSQELVSIATPSTITCPHCQGVLSEMKGEGPLRYRCQIGHAFTAEAAIEASADSVDEALRIALRIMEERLMLVTRMAADARAQGRAAIAELYEARAEEYGGHAASLRSAASLTMRIATAAE